MLESKKSKTFLTTNGYEVIVDEEDYEKIVNHKRWSVRCKVGTKIPAAVTGLANFLIGRKKDFLIDHINRNPLDNRKSNLRYATVSQNMRNRQKPKSRKFTSMYKGVCFSKSKNRFVAAIAINKVTVRLGSFVNEADAALAYNKAAKKYHGAFAVLNNIEQDSQFLFPL